jgi:hypothetical protein
MSGYVKKYTQADAQRDANSVYRIYKIDCPDGRSYIGCTKRTLAERIASHLAEVRGFGRKMLNPNIIGFAIDRYGRDAITVQQIASAVGADSAAYVETLLIKQHGTLFPGGYNIRDVSAVRRGVAIGVGRSMAKAA